MLVALALALLAQEASKLPDGYVPPKTYATFKKWTVDQSFDKDMCTISTTYDGDTDFYALYYPRRNRLTVYINDPVLKALKPDVEYKVKLIFVRPNKFDDSWGEITIHGYTDIGGKPGYVFTLNATDALKDIAVSTMMATMYEEKVVDSLKLEGSSDMVAAVRRCGAEIVKAHPIDPFEK